MDDKVIMKTGKLLLLDLKSYVLNDLFTSSEILKCLSVIVSKFPDYRNNNIVFSPFPFFLFHACFNMNLMPSAKKSWDRSWWPQYCFKNNVSVLHLLLFIWSF